MSGEFVRDYDQVDSSGRVTPIKNDRCYPIFTKKFIQNKPESIKQGKIVGEYREMVEVVIAGDRSQSWYGKVTDEHRDRWRPLYDAWKRGEEAPLDGTPLEKFPLIHESFAHQLRALGIRTVEQMANLTDTQAQGFMGGTEWRRKAHEFLNRDGTEEQRKIRALEQQVASIKQADPPAVVPNIEEIVARAVAAALAQQAALSPVARPKKERTEKQKANDARLAERRKGVSADDQPKAE